MSKLQGAHEAAGVSRRDRYKGAQAASTRQITKRDSHGLNSSRRESGALPFDGDSAPGAPADESFDADDADADDGEAEADQSFEAEGDEDGGADEAETTLDSTSTPRSTRRSPARSPVKRASPAASPAAASSSSAAAAAAAPASSRSTRHSVAASPAAAKSGRKSSAAAAAVSPSSSPAAASPSIAGSPSFSPAMAGGRSRTKRADELRMSTTFALPFSRGPSRAPSMAPSHAGGGADEDEEDEGEEEDIGQRYALPEDVSFVADDGYGDDDQGGQDEESTDEPMQEERKSMGSSKKRPSSMGGAAAAASSSSSAAAAAAAVPSKRAAPAPKRPRADAAAGAGAGAVGKGKGVGRKTMQIVATGRMYDGLGDIGEEKDGFASDAEGSPAANKRPKRTHIPPTAWWEMKEVNYLFDERGKDGTMAHIDPENPIKVIVESVAPKDRARPKSHKKHSSGSSSAAAAAAGGLKLKEREVKKKPIPTNMQIVDATGAEITVPAVAKHADHIPLESLGGAGVDPKSLPFPLPHGGKAFEQPEFSSGLLMLPPRAKKQLEEANNNEVFYVIEGPANMLQVTVHHTVLHLSKASQFMIPTGNRYSMQNLSHTESITLHFVLVKPAQTWMNEWHAQHKAQQDEMERLAQQEDEEPEEEEEEEEEVVPAPRKNKGQAKRK